MLNYNDKEITSIITSDLEIAESRTRITVKSDATIEAMKDSELWAANNSAQTNTLLDFTTLLADKIHQSLADVNGLGTSNFFKQLWLKPVVPDADHTTIVFFQATPDGNKELFTIVDPLRTDGRLVASNLPTLIQITAKSDDALGYSDDEVTALIAMVKELYAAGYAFRTVDETVLQPVDGLTFATKFDTSRPLLASATVQEAGNIRLAATINGTAAGYHVYDEEHHDWMDLGTDTREGDQFVWESTSIPEDLVGQKLTLAVSVQSVDNVPAMDELFVIASSNAILMKESVNPGEYSLSLPNHKDLTVRVNPMSGTVTLGYPEPTTQIIELDNQYPFLGEWLKSVLPKKPAFN
ncbi:hypothetical protein [Lacticaseibacillus sharpeae]|uniref:Uncharacterized protein n=1 Tax=Lacticaseibacillus sharpeae JCM 1186 = DSM 20505 TaxID=1291052 RepID=A0A0R1ZMD5_9LACO|nr:hypothetical protein [Lacticaseibacillus sharpeae]KRM56232.1 hypothetical protein FC18_GL000212 [Lacticaseibacillus sharpeae JCM 1186 = DSM 20505]